MSWEPPGAPTRRTAMHDTGPIALDDSDDSDIVSLHPAQVGGVSDYTNGYQYPTHSVPPTGAASAAYHAAPDWDEVGAKRARVASADDGDDSDDICEIDKDDFVALPQPTRVRPLQHPPSASLPTLPTSPGSVFLLV